MDHEHGKGTAVHYRRSCLVSGMVYLLSGALSKSDHYGYVLAARSWPAPSVVLYTFRGDDDALLWEPPADGWTALRLVTETLVCARLLGVAGRTGATQVDHDPGSTTGQRPLERARGVTKV